MSHFGLRPRGPAAPRPEEDPAAPVPTREVLNELARGFLLGLKEEDPRFAARFASQFVSEQSGSMSDRSPVRPRTVRGPLARASADGRTLEPPP